MLVATAMSSPKFRNAAVGLIENRIPGGAIVGTLGKEVGGKLLDAGKTAATSVVASRIDSLSQNLAGRSKTMRDGAPNGQSRSRADEAADDRGPEEPEDEAYDEEEEPTKPKSPKTNTKKQEDEEAEEPTDEYEEQEDEEAEEPTDEYEEQEDEEAEEPTDEYEEQEDEEAEEPDRRIRRARRRGSRRARRRIRRAGEEEGHPGRGARRTSSPIPAASTECLASGSKERLIWQPIRAIAVPDTDGQSGACESLASQLGLNRLGEQLQGLASAMADRGVSVVTDRLDGLTDKMSGATGKTVKNMAKGDSAPKAALKAGVESVKDSGAERSFHRSRIR